MKRNNVTKLTAGLLLIIFSLAIALGACSTQVSHQSSQPPSAVPASITETKVRVAATQNFGQELMFDKEIELEDDACAMDALKKVAEIETAYNGGFINAINGVRSQYAGSSGNKKDWFICVNGILSNAGALDYNLYPGDVEHWDFHDWSFQSFIPAIIGDFPEPFVHGYEGEIRPTIVVYEDNLEKTAEDIVAKLSQLGAESISAKNINELSGDEKESCNLILLGDMNCELISELNQIWKRLGFFTHFEEGKLVVLNQKGDTAIEYGAECGLIQATQNLWNPKGIGVCENVVWMISGTDETGVKNAVDALINHHSEFQYAFAAIITDGEIVKVPQLNH